MYEITISAMTRVFDVFVTTVEAASGSTVRNAVTKYTLSYYIHKCISVK